MWFPLEPCARLDGDCVTPGKVISSRSGANFSTNNTGREILGVRTNRPALLAPAIASTRKLLTIDVSLQAPWALLGGIKAGFFGSSL
jgi:hypothetical protein